MNIETIQKLWEVDSHINSEEFDKESTKIPQLHMRYMDLFNTMTLLKKDRELELKRTNKEKWLYYKGRAPASVYKFQPFDLKLTTSDEIKMFIDADEEIQKLKYKIAYADQCCVFLESILKQITNRGFQIKNAVDWQKFQAGF
tara:strand:- start:678 stop:1106 length:429 start_codon:yes stop_codon:yes gene_type:complete